MAHNIQEVPDPILARGGPRGLGFDLTSLDFEIIMENNEVLWGNFELLDKAVDWSSTDVHIAFRIGKGNCGSRGEVFNWGELWLFLTIVVVVVVVIISSFGLGLGFVIVIFTIVNWGGGISARGGIGWIICRGGISGVLILNLIVVGC